MAGKGRRQARPIPENWEVLCLERRMTFRQLSEAFGCDDSVISKWGKLTGIRPARWCIKCNAAVPAEQFSSLRSSVCRLPHPDYIPRKAARKDPWKALRSAAPDPLPLPATRPLQLQYPDECPTAGAEL